MKITYGTAGFRYNHKIIEEIAFKIGIGLVLCSIFTNKRIGVMITASHNKYEDNGIKITDDKGEMISQQLEETMTRVVNSEFGEIPNLTVEIVIGQDTRKSGTKIKNLIIDGAKSVCDDVRIVDLGKVTTPEHHYYLHNNIKPWFNSYDDIQTQDFDRNIVFKQDQDYVDKYIDIYSKLEIDRPVVVDCANGVGYLTLSNILKGSEKESSISLVNIDTKKYTQLNNKCGSDYVMNNLTKDNVPYIGQEHNKLGVSFDGDADRIICYFEENDKMYLLDGDHISALILYYFTNVLKLGNGLIDISVIHTGYSNGAFIDFCEKKGINTICCPTGVKHLDKEARDKEIGLYFEYNGHGTCLFKDTFSILPLQPQKAIGCKLQSSCDFPKFDFLKQVFNQVVGDAIGTLAAILFILNETKLGLMDWYKLYDKRNCLNSKVQVKDKTVYKTNSLGTKLLEPQEIALNIRDVFDEEEVRGFIRPSGTEDIVRIYVEGDKTDDELKQIVEKIKKILI